ncbi:MAG: LytTR family DNA-binding domain-containing protein [Cyclobacteriaceae bacterium]|nr:LytTR family DNA-binding domain-containing protein [Cyclobacteriaceae bacterium]
MINVLIVEDELPAVNRLKGLLRDTDFDTEVCGVCDSVESVLQWLKSNPSPDLAFFDIQLSDGLVFEIFDYHSIDFPVVFLTAYDQYALKAFEVNGLDYLLKPVSKENLTNSIVKIEKLVKKWSDKGLDQAEWGSGLAPKLRSRFLVKMGEHLRSLPVSIILCFYSFQKSAFCIDESGKKYLIDLGIDKIESSLDPEKFFRVNRQFIVSIQSIEDIIQYSNSRLKLHIKKAEDQEIIVARERVKSFKEWLDK